ncbi:type VI secretion system tube protein Hcp [Buttiauxella sp. A2-C1_F]|uniref:type VI secretion system tube protein Hcp n=1 Tax=unclassified Buttiauxella TaxID=2634062 RepID=UPI001E5370CE|nr:MULTISPECIES: type VI secretion system tube protein Hcp [unclassified Buttiauxella]MCE0798967.1 type VI secretion system tube protein Hcp [Buttiauxella sp. W03-F01]MCE0811560.1 type VI secretion system tube protein Hcp [Buttiauxella sp. S04-F03]MCE0844167.1 type VI secretion system tube protein Hcp [Buttiauxella sp. A2-C1_F]
MSTNTLFMHIKGFTGDTPPDDIKEWIPLENMSMHAFSSARIDGSSGKVTNDGSPHFENLSFKKSLDERSPKLLNKIAEATEIEEVIVKQMTKLGSDDKELMKYTFGKCLFIAHSLEARNSGGVPQEDYVMAYDTMLFKVAVPVDPKTNKEGEMSWSNIENTKM